MSFYTDEQILEILHDLGITDKEIAPILRTTLDSAAKNYLDLKKRRETKLTPTQEKQKLKQLSNHLEKSAKLYDEITKSFGSIFRFYDGLSLSGKEHPEIHQIIIQNSYDEFILNPKFIKGLLEVLHQSALEAEKEPLLSFSKRTKTELVYAWLETIVPFWKNYSKINISEGRHDDDLGRYDSPAMRIFYKMAVPLRLEGSIIAEAIKDYRALIEQQSQAFFKRPRSLFQEK